MNKKLVSVCLALAFGAGAGYATTVLAQAKPDQLVKQRQSAMTLISKYFGPLGAMAKGKAPYDADVAARNAGFLVALSQMPWDGFHPSTKGIDSKALPAVYENEAKFKEAAERMQGAMTKLAGVARDEGAFKDAVGAAAKACGACHNDFRAK